MNKLASMSDEERTRLLDEFWAEMTQGLDVDPEFYAGIRSAKPRCPTIRRPSSWRRGSSSRT